MLSDKQIFKECPEYYSVTDPGATFEGLPCLREEMRGGQVGTGRHACHLGKITHGCTLSCTP